MPSNRYFMKTLTEKFQSMTTALKSILAKQESVCMTCDVWTSRAQAYIGMTVHFLTSDFERKSYVLAFRQMKRKQTHKELVTEIAGVMREFSLTKDNVTNIVTDGCSAFTKGFRLFGTCDRLATHSQSEFEEIANEDNENDESNESGDFLPFIQNEDGEFFIANELNLEPGDNSITNNLDADEEDEIDVEQQSLVNELLSHNDEHEVPAHRDNTIDLPAQRRCASHQMNLASQDFEKNLPNGPKSVLVGAINKLQQLWVRTHKSAMAKTICKEVYIRTISIFNLN